MSGAIAVSGIPIAVAFVFGVGAFVALLPLLIADERRARQPMPASEPRVLTPPPAPTSVHASTPARAPVRVSRLRLVVTVGALVAWSVWSVRRPLHRGRHD